MKIAIHGVNRGYRTLTPDHVDGLFDARSNVNNTAACGQEAYSIHYGEGSVIFSKYKIVLDALGNLRLGNVAFSIIIQNDKRLKGADVKSLLDRVDSEFSGRYVKADKLGEVRNDWAFIDEITNGYRPRLENNPYPAAAAQPDVDDAAFVYYSNAQALEKYFDWPYQSNYSPYKQVFFVAADLKGKNENPLNALRHAEDADLTEKVPPPSQPPPQPAARPVATPQQPAPPIQHPIPPQPVATPQQPVSPIQQPIPPIQQPAQRQQQYTQQQQPVPPPRPPQQQAMTPATQRGREAMVFGATTTDTAEPKFNPAIIAAAAFVAGIAVTLLFMFITGWTLPSNDAVRLGLNGKNDNVTPERPKEPGPGSSGKKHVVSYGDFDWLKNYSKSIVDYTQNDELLMNVLSDYQHIWNRIKGDNNITEEDWENVKSDIDIAIQFRRLVDNCDFAELTSGTDTANCPVAHKKYLKTINIIDPTTYDCHKSNLQNITDLPLKKIEESIGKNIKDKKCVLKPAPQSKPSGQSKLSVDSPQQKPATGKVGEQ